MKKFYSIIAVLLLIATVFTTLVACQNVPDNNDGDDSDKDTVKTLDISGYMIVRSDGASTEISKFVSEFKKILLSYTGAALPVQTDYLEDGEKENADAKEIIIGEVNREESKSVVSDLKKNTEDGAYTIKITENKIVIAGKTEAATIRAMKRFLMNYAKECTVEKSIVLKNGNIENGVVNVNSLVFDNFTEFDIELTSDIALPENPNKNSTLAYETMIRLYHNGKNNGTLFASYASYGKHGYKIYKSTDNGATWKYISTAVDDYNKDPWVHSMTSDCLQPCLYELPKDMGDFKEGTLILGACSNGIKGRKETTSITLYYSTDLGENWKAYCNVDIAGNDPDDDGVWEPFFIFEEETGRVYCFYSDESGEKAGPRAQKLVYKYSTDMKTWVGKDGRTGVQDDPFDAINGDEPTYRPGMISIADMGEGGYFMTYEMCGVSGCPIYYKKTDKLDDWGDIKDYGTLIQTDRGNSIGSAPWCAWTPEGGEYGTLIVVAHHNTKGTPITTDENGKNIGTDMLLSFDYGETWIGIENPLPYDPTIITAHNPDNSKSSYSPFVGFSEDGRTLYYLNNPPYNKYGQKISFARIKIW